MHVPAKVSVMSLTIVGLAFLPPPHQDECFTWRLDSSAEMSDGSASIRLTDRPTTSIGWNVAVLTGPLLGVSAERNAKWRNSEGDSIRITWRNSYTRGSYAFGRTTSGMSGTVTLVSTDVITVDSTGTVIPYTPRSWRVVAVARPCPA